MKQVIYTASPESEQIHVWQLAEEGTLSLLQTVNTPGQAQPLVINTHHQVLYAGVKPEFKVVAWKIMDDGSLAPLGDASLPGSATYLATDRQGEALYISYYHDGLVSYSPIDGQGLPSAPTQVIDGLAGCHSANINLQNDHLYTPALKQDRIAIFPRNADNSLDHTAFKQLNTVTGAGPRHMDFHPNGKFAYTINELDSTLVVIRLDAAGDEIIQTLDTQPDDFTGTRWAADIHLTPDARYLYTCDRTSSLLTVFSVSASGDALNLVGFHPTETQPRGFAIDAEGKFILSTGQKSHHLAVHRIDPETGKLSDVARYPAGQGPMWAVTHTLG